jgi:predicted GH43/DUF377 family glycosyl hydrolase
MFDTLSTLIISLASFVLALILLCYAWKSSGKDKKRVKRHARNPIMSPAPFNEWESGGTFNPASIKDSGGRIHLVYRAVGADGVSRIGYASSFDGITIDDRSPYPIFAIKNPRQNLPEEFKQRNIIMYPSGGSWGGSEDPRLVRIGDKVYMTFNAFDDWDYIRIGLTSIKADDFFKKKWKWSRPLMISPKGEVNKNWVLFPEKINGKFAILHSMSPKVQVDYVDRLEDLDSGRQAIKSHFGQKESREEWDTWIRGVGPPPVKTEKGWLVLYHAINKNEPDKYKLGALLLDEKNPRKVLARSPAPLLTSETWYENDWKHGVIYACGTVVKDGTLYIYYGGGDKHVCVAHTNLDELLKWLLKFGGAS